LATPDSIGPRSSSEHRFFGAMAIAIAATIVAGFARTYYLRPLFVAAGGHVVRTLTPLIHVHGLLFSGWIALLVLQTRLVAARRVDLHRRFGVAGALLAAAMVPVGLVVAFQGVVRGTAAPGMDPRRFLALPFFAVVVFAVLLAAALWLRRDPQTHKRLVLLATLALLPPAIARWVIFQFGFAPPVVFVLVTLFLVPLVVWDLRTLGRLHPATLWGGLFLVLSAPGRFLLAGTDLWLAFADWAAALVR